MKTNNSISSLGISIEDLYNEKQQLRVNISDRPYTFSILLKGRDGEPDCKISSWEANLYFRTRNGMNRKKYSSLNALQNALVKKVNEYVDTVGSITFSLSNEIDII